MEFIDRTANNPNRFKITYEDSGSSSFAKIELADNPIEAGTPLNRASFETMQSDLLSGKKGVHSVSAGGTGANNKEQALANLGAAPKATHNILTFDQLSQLGIKDANLSATDLAANISTIISSVGNNSMANSTHFIFMQYASLDYQSNFCKSIFAKINADVGTTYTNSQVRIEIKGTRQSFGAKNITVTVDYSDEVKVYEGIYDSSYNGNLSTFVETTPHKFNKPLLTGASLSDGDTKTISNASGYNLFAIKMRCVMGYEATETMVLAYANPISYAKNLKGTNGDFHFEGAINTDSNKLTVYYASCGEQPAYVVDIIGVM